MPKMKSIWKRHSEGKHTRYYQRAAMRKKIAKAATYEGKARLRDILNRSMLEVSRMRRAMTAAAKYG